MFEDVSIRDLVGALSDHDFGAALEGTHDQQMGSERIDAIGVLERVKRWADAGIAAQTAALDAQRCAVANPHPDLGFVDEGLLTKSLIAELALVRQMSNSGAATLYGFAMTARHLPTTMGLLAGGAISLRVAKAVADEVTTLTAEQTRQVDAQIGAKLDSLTAKRAAQVARRLVIGIDPHAADTRAKRARADRHVSVSAARDAMGKLNLYIGAEQAWACFGALDSHARGMKADGDGRTIGQLMADTPSNGSPGRAVPTVFRSRSTC